MAVTNIMKLQLHVKFVPLFTIFMWVDCFLAQRSFVASVSKKTSWIRIIAEYFPLAGRLLIWKDHERNKGIRKKNIKTKWYFRLFKFWKILQTKQSKLEKSPFLLKWSQFKDHNDMIFSRNFFFFSITAIWGKILKCCWPVDPYL